MTKNKMSVSKKIKIINIILILYIFMLATGYAYFNESLTVNGVANTVEIYEGNTLPINLLVLDTANNRHYLENGSKNKLEFKREIIDGDSYTVFYKKAIGMIAGKVTSTYTVAFTNPTALDFTDGKIETWEVQDDISSSLENLSGSISKMVVKPGETVEVSMTVTHTFSIITNRHKIGAHVTFMLQNKERNFYFFVQWDPNAATYEIDETV